MLPSEKLAIAAHLHVLLRRKTGRVTDTEWMAANVEYATEIVRFSRMRAKEDGHADLAEWADKLAATLPAAAVVATSPKVVTSMGFFRNALAASAPAPTTADRPDSVLPQETGNLLRYVNGIR